MDPVTLILGLALVGGALALILYPLWQQTRPESVFQTNRAGRTLEEVEARYGATLAAIKDLMFDYEMGKVAAEDYEVLLNRAKLDAAALRRQIDRLSQENGPAVNPALDAEIERLVAGLRQKSDLNGQAALAGEVEAEIELLKLLQVEGEDEETLCPGCGKPVRPDDVFCSRCGYSLAQDTRPARPKVSANACVKCGYTFRAGDAFCVKCGEPLGKKAVTAVPRAG